MEADSSRAISALVEQLKANNDQSKLEKMRNCSMANVPVLDGSNFEEWKSRIEYWSLAPGGFIANVAATSILSTISDIVGSSGDDLVNGVSNSNYPTGNDSCTSSCSEHNDNNHHHHLHQNNGDFVSTGSTTLEYQHFVDDHMMIGRNNKKLESTVIPSLINKQQQNNKNSENVVATSILSTMENVSSITSNNSSKVCCLFSFVLFCKLIIFYFYQIKNEN